MIKLKVGVEHRRNALGIGSVRPRLSWVVETDAPNWIQESYSIEKYDDLGNKTGETHRVISDESVLVKWPFDPLASRERASISVRVWGTDGNESDWSEQIPLEVGLIDEEDWSAKFITPDWKEPLSQSNPAPYFRREFSLRSNIKSARLYVTALGVYEVEVNGQAIGDHVLSPGWTVYDERLRYQTFDVTGNLFEGENAIGAVLGDGWFRGRLGFGGGVRNIYGDHIALLAQLEVEYLDGEIETVITDANWRAATGPILMNSIYDGEYYDARLEHAGWSQSGFDDSGWEKVKVMDWKIGALEAPLGPPVRRIETIKPVSISASPSGKTIVDFGQNLVGRVSIKVKGKKGDTVTLRHAEVLENGELATRLLRFAEATDKYTLKGGETEVWEPRFTFHGFRYLEVTGWPGNLNPSDVTAVVLHSDMEKTGWFECSEPLLTKFHENVVWGMRGNFLDIPTDCPQRDERLGWTGDLQIFAPTAAFLFDVSGFLESWLRDLAVEQRKSEGIVPPIIPNVLNNSFGAAAWADAAVIVPWVIFQRYGDKKILANQFDSMCAWVDHVAEIAGNRKLWEKRFQFGDWLDPTAPPDKPGQARTDRAIVASGYFAHSAEVLAKTAEILEREQEQKKYLELAIQARTAFAEEFVTPAGRLMSDTETAYALALVFNLIPSAEQRQRAGERLDELVRESGYHIRTGFVGTPLICDALCETGYQRTAFRLMLQRGNPSWLYPVTMGATTVWERWDSMLPDGSLNTGEMTSFNHYALGAVADWIHRTIGGIKVAKPGYHHIQIEPKIGGGLTYAKIAHKTPYGRVESEWVIRGGKVSLRVLIPPNTTASVVVPGHPGKKEVGSGEWGWSLEYTDHEDPIRYTVDDLVGDILSDDSARKAIMDTLEREEIPEYLRGMIFNEPTLPLRQALIMFPDYEEAIRMMSSALSNGT